MSLVDDFFCCSFIKLMKVLCFLRRRVGIPGPTLRMNSSQSSSSLRKMWDSMHMVEDMEAGGWCAMSRLSRATVKGCHRRSGWDGMARAVAAIGAGGEAHEIPIDHG